MDKKWYRLITAVILVFVSISNVYSFTNRPSKPPVGARIDPLHPINRDLVAWWLFNEGSGSTLTDIAVKYQGSLTNMDANDWVGSHEGGSLDFDSVNDYVNFGIQPDLRFNSGNFTIMGWVNLADATGNNTLVSNYINESGYIFGILSSKVGYYTTVASKFANTTLFARVWYHIGITVDSSGNYIFYLNGVADGSGTSVLPVANEDTFKIGAYGAPTSFINGAIAYVRMYGRVLLADEMSALYRNSYIGLRQSPVKWYGVGDAPVTFTPTVTWW